MKKPWLWWFVLTWAVLACIILFRSDLGGIDAPVEWWEILAAAPFLAGLIVLRGWAWEVTSRILRGEKRTWKEFLHSPPVWLLALMAVGWGVSRVHAPLGKSAWCAL